MSEYFDEETNKLVLSAFTRERIQALIEDLKGVNDAHQITTFKETVVYNQNSWLYKDECGTVCCLAGLTIIKWGALEKWLEALKHEVSTVHFISAAARLLGLKYDTAEVLFLGHGMVEFEHPVVAKDAIEVLENLLDGISPSTSWNSIAQREERESE